MKAKINEHGDLNIWRGTGYRAQYCPYGISHTITCGDWCPLFGELEDEYDGNVVLMLCKRTLRFKRSNFIDAREEA